MLMALLEGLIFSIVGVAVGWLAKLLLIVLMDLKFDANNLYFLYQFDFNLVIFMSIMIVLPKIPAISKVRASAACVIDACPFNIYV